MKEPIEKSLLSNNNEIFVTYNLDQSETFLEFYRNNDIKILDLHNKNTLVGKIPKLGVLYNFNRQVKSICQKEKLDLIHIHSVNSYILTSFIVNFLNRYTRRIVCTIYGSDILLKSSYKLKKWQKIFNKIDAISMATNNLIKKFKGVYGTKYDEKIFKLPFGLTNLEAIDAINDQSNCKRILGVNSEKVMISIGHNKCVEQQHLEVMDAFLKLPKDVLDKLTIVLQMTYGNGSREYVKEVKAKAQKLGCDLLIFEDYMDEKEIAVLVKATDYYINSQKSDAMSGAMLEYLYADTIVLNPSWLDYDELKENGCSFISYQSFEEMKDIVKELVEGKISLDISHNYSIIKNMAHWEVNSQKWKKFLYFDSDCKE